MSTTTRRHDIDALRALAFALLILYHLAMLYVADWGWHLKSPHLATWLQTPMLFLNRWRMDLIFLISGVASGFLLKPDRGPSRHPASRGTGASMHGVGRFLWSRHWRLVLPLAFGCLVIVPIQPYAQGVANGAVQPGFLNFLHDYFGGRTWPKDAFDGWEHSFTWNHLWYLAYLWMYTIALAVLAKPLESAPARRLRAWFAGLRGPALLILPALPLLAWTLLLQMRFPDKGDFVHDWYRNAMYFTVFLYGYLLAREDGFWAEAARLRKHSLALALGCVTPYLVMVNTLPDDISWPVQALVWALRNLYVWSMLLTLLGWAHAFLNRPFRWLPWANEAVYPWYMLHQSFIVGLAYWLLPMHFGPVAEPLLILSGTVAGCWTVFAIARRVRWLRPLFGMKMHPREAARPVLLQSAQAQ